MYEQILSSLKTTYKSLGLDENYLKVIAKRIARTVKEESEIEAAVNDVQDEVSLTQRQTDQIRTMQKSMKTLTDMLAKQAKGHQEEEEPKEKKKTETTPEEVPSWAKGLTETITALSQGLTDLKTERTNQTNGQKLLSQLKELGVKESFYKFHIPGKTFENDDQITEFAKSLKESQDAFIQENSDKKVSDVSNPLHADSKQQKGVSSAAQAFITQNLKSHESAKPGADTGLQ